MTGMKITGLPKGLCLGLRLSGFVVFFEVLSCVFGFFMLRHAQQAAAALSGASGRLATVT